MWFLSRLFMKYADRNVPFVIANWAQKFQSEAIDRTADLLEGFLGALATLRVSLEYRNVHEHTMYTYTDMFGRRKRVEFPVLGQNEIHAAQRSNSFYIFSIVLLFLFESIMFSFLGNNAIDYQTNKLYPLLKYIFGAAVAFGLLVCCHYAIQLILEYIKALTVVRTEQVDKRKMLPFKMKLVIGILLAVFFVGYTIAVGPIRAKYMEGADGGDGFMLAVSLIGTFASSLAMAMSKWKMLDKKELYDMQQAWTKFNKRLERDMKQFININDRLATGKIRIQERCFMLVCDLQRLFELRIDIMFQPLLDEYENAVNVCYINNQPFVITPVMYKRFRNIIAEDKELLLFIVQNDARLLKLFTRVEEETEAIRKLLESFKRYSVSVPVTLVHPASNGYLHHPEQEVKAALSLQ